MYLFTSLSPAMAHIDSIKKNKLFIKVKVKVSGFVL